MFVVTDKPTGAGYQLKLYCVCISCVCKIPVTIIKYLPTYGLKKTKNY